MRGCFKLMLVPAMILAGLQVAAAQDVLATKTMKSLTMKGELMVAQTAIETCAAQNIHVHAFIVDASGTTRLQLLGDGSRVSTIDSARRKAFTAAIMGRATAAIQKQIKENPGMQLPPDDRMLFVGGGVPIRAGSEVIGAIGVGGGTTDQDDACAQAGVAKIQPYLQ